MKEAHNKSTDDQDYKQNGDRDKALAVFRRIDLLPNDKRQPCLENIRHFVHASDNQGSLFIIVRAYLMGPAVVIVLGHLHFYSLGNI